MAVRYRKPNMSLLRSGGGTRALGESFSTPTYTAKPRRIHGIATQRRRKHTIAEKEFEKILNKLGGGVLSGKYIREWAFKCWIIDFYLYEVRVGIEIDGPYHSLPEQQLRDRKKTMDCESAGITLVRISNFEVFGDRDKLIEKLRAAYRIGLQRSRRRPNSKAI